MQAEASPAEAVAWVARKWERKKKLYNVRCGPDGRILISLAKYSYKALKSLATKLYCIILYHLVLSRIQTSLGTNRKVRMRSEGLKAHAYAHFIKSASRFIIKYQYYRAVVTGKRKTRRAERSLQTIAKILPQTVTCNSSLHPGSRCRL